MNKFLCYIAIVVLIILIAIPPLTRIFYKEKEVLEVVRDTYTLLTCKKESYIINESYKNDDPLSIKFTIPLKVEEVELEKGDFELTLENELKNIVNSTQDGEKQELSYVLQYQNFDSSKLNGFSKYRLSLDNQIIYYEENGYNCNKMIQ